MLLASSRPCGQRISTGLALPTPLRWRTQLQGDETRRFQEDRKAALLFNAFCDKKAQSIKSLSVSKSGAGATTIGLAPQPSLSLPVVLAGNIRIPSELGCDTRSFVSVHVSRKALIIAAFDVGTHRAVWLMPQLEVSNNLGWQACIPL